MGEIALAAKITHVPSIWMSEMYDKHKGIRENAIKGLNEIGRRARAAGVDAFVVIDCHWITNQGFHLNATAGFSGRFTSPELPHFLKDMDFAYEGDPELGQAIAERVDTAGFRSIAHDDPNLRVEYGTLIPMRHMNGDGFAKVVPVAANQFASIEEGKRMGEAMAEAIAASGRKVGLLASGSMSHAFWPNAVSEAGINEVNGEFNYQVDMRVLELWREGRFKEFLRMLPDYARLCQGECNMIDTAMLFGALGWDSFQGRGEVVGEYFGSSGTGQVNVHFTP
jgi:3,4-dihydroxyphenylacetate 2,3-dioxygenase